jgi:hypothetical protein
VLQNERFPGVRAKCKAIRPRFGCRGEKNNNREMGERGREVSGRKRGREWEIERGRRDVRGIEREGERGR